MAKIPAAALRIIREQVESGAASYDSLNENAKTQLRQAGYQPAVQAPAASKTASKRPTLDVGDLINRGVFESATPKSPESPLARELVTSAFPRPTTVSPLLTAMKNYGGTQINQTPSLAGKTPAAAMSRPTVAPVRTPSSSDAFKAGMADLTRIAGGAAKWLGAEETGQKWVEAGTKVGNYYGGNLPRGEGLTDPNTWKYDVVRALPSTLTLLPLAAAGALVGSGAAGLAGLGSIGTGLATFGGGALTSRAAESLFEAGDAYQVALDRGMTEKDASKAAGSVYVKNLGLTGMDAIELVAAFGRVPGAGKIANVLSKAGKPGQVALGAGRIGATGLMEGAEEGIQQAFQGQALGEDTRGTIQQILNPNPEVAKSMQVGAAMGLGLGGLGAAHGAIGANGQAPAQVNPDQRWQDIVNAFKVPQGQPIQPAVQPSPVSPFSTGMQDFNINNISSPETAVRDYIGRTAWPFPQGYLNAPPRSGGEVTTLPIAQPRTVRSGAINLSGQVAAPPVTTTLPNTRPVEPVVQAAPVQQSTAQPRTDFTVGERVEWTDLNGNAKPGTVFGVDGENITVTTDKGGRVPLKIGRVRKIGQQVAPAAEPVSLALPEAKQPVQATKEPWEMTWEEFKDEFLLHGTATKGIEEIRPHSFFSADPRRTLDYAKTGRPHPFDTKPKDGGEVLVVRRSDDPSFTGSRIQYQSSQGLKPIARVPESEAHNPHRYVIQQALSEGKPVPPEVLADYPDLVEQDNVPSEVTTVPAVAKEPWEMTKGEWEQDALYHGGKYSPDEYDITKASDEAQYGKGFYAGGKGFAEEWAKERGGSIHRTKLKMDRPFDEKNIDSNDPMHQKVINSLVEAGLPKKFVEKNYGGLGTFEFFASKLKAGEKSMFPGSAKMAEILKKAGFDGIIGEFRDDLQYAVFDNKQVLTHKKEVQKALSEGKTVSREVLADYPDLAKQVKTATEFTTAPTAVEGDSIGTTTPAIEGNTPQAGAGEAAAQVPSTIETAGSALADYGLSLTSSKTVNGNTEWKISGNTKAYKNILQKLGGRKKSSTTWSFYGDKNPTEKIMRQLSTEDIQAMPAGSASTAPLKAKSPVLDTVKRRDIVKFLDEKLNVPIRVGRYNIKNALGIFKVKPEVIRSRIANDLPTISHEVGHKLDKQLGLADPAHDAELMTLGQVTSAKNYTPDQVRKEGIAEFMRLYLTNEQAAQSLAPKYYAAFEKQMTSYPDIHDTLLRARQDIFTWYNQPAKARVLGVLSTSQKSQRKMSLDRLYSLTIDEIDPIRHFVEDVGVKGLPIEKDPYKLAWLARGWTGKAEVLIHRGVLDDKGRKIGKSLNEILKPIEKELDDFRAYAMAKHSLEVTAQGKNTGILDADAREVIKNSPAKYQQTMDDLVKYQDAVLNQLVDAGVMDAAAVQKMRQMYPNYIPFQRVFDESPGAVTEWLSKGGFANLNNPVKSLKGSDREIIDPLESIIKNTYTFANIAEKNKVGRAIAELANMKEGIGRLVEKVDGSQSGRENILKVFRDGKPEHYQLQPDLYRATLALDRESANILVKLLQYPAGWLRAGATLSPDFMVRNPIRDMFSAFINSKYGFVPVVDTMRGLFHAVKKDELYWQWMNSGGAHSMMVSIDRDYLQKSLREMLKKSPKGKAIAVVNPKTYLGMLRSLSEMGEEATRLGEFGKGIRSGANPLEAALASRDVTLDFSRVGSKTKSANKAIAFFNAQLQGIDKTVRQIKANPVGTVAKIIISITLPSVLLYLNNRDDPRYQELPRWQKDLFWIIPTENHLFKIPKPFELGILFGSVPERILEYIDSQDKKSFDELGKTIWSAGVPNIIPTALLPPIEAMSNYSFFTDRTIVPQREQKLEPQMQYGPYTTESAKAVGDVSNISPRKIEHVFRGYTGGLGMYVVKGGEAIADAAGAMDRTPRPAWAVEDVPGIKAVMTKPYESSQSINEFYDELNTLESQYQTMKQTKSGPPEGFSMGRLKTLREVSERLQDLRKTERHVEASETMTPEIKRRELDRLNMIMLNAVRRTQGKENLAQ